jgi:hypothetical protein
MLLKGASPSAQFLSKKLRHYSAMERVASILLSILAGCDFEHIQIMGAAASLKLSFVPSEKCDMYIEDFATQLAVNSPCPKCARAGLKCRSSQHPPRPRQSECHPIADTVKV